MKFNLSRKHIKQVISTAIVLFSLYIIYSLNLLTGISTAIFDIFAPMQEKASSVVYFVSDLENKIENYFLTYKNNEILKEENNNLKKHFYLNQKLQQENEELRKSLNFAETQKHEFITAQVIARTNSSGTQRIIINAGKLNGLEKGLLAIYNEQLVGRIIEVTNKTATILLLTDSLSSIPVVTTTSRIKCLAAGFSSVKIICKYLDDNIEINQGELVVTSDDSLSIIPNIIVGNIYKQGDYFYIKSGYDYNKIRYVQIIKP